MNVATVRKLLAVLILSTFCLISLGGAVRAMQAGLSCPDWPLCFGSVIPDYQIQVYYEFIHRVLAGLVGILTFTLAFFTLKNSSVSYQTKFVVGLALGVLLAQIVLGGLTVIKQLQSIIVTSHLGFGMAFFGLQLWWYFSLAKVKVEMRPPIPRRFYFLALATAVFIYFQIVLGGIVSTNYAGVACPDWPFCMGELVPTLSGLMGLQVMHRLMAYTVAIMIFALYLSAKHFDSEPWMDRRYYNISAWLALSVVVQIGIGVSNVLFRTPPLLTVLHLATASILFALVLRLLFLVWAHQKAENLK